MSRKTISGEASENNKRSKREAIEQARYGGRNLTQAWKISVQSAQFPVLMGEFRLICLKQKQNFQFMIQKTTGWSNQTGTHLL